MKKNLLTLLTITLTMSSLYAQGDAPLYFRMGEYNIKYTIDSLECFYFDKQWYGMHWMTTFVEESIILHPDHQYYYEKTESYNTFTSVIYSYGTWFYQDSIFYFNSEIDTLQLNETWRERQKRANNPVSFFEFSEIYKSLQMHDVKLYNHGNYAVSWSEDCQRELLRFDVTKKEDFDDFIYLFINKPKFREMRMGVAHSACYVPINSENENGLVPLYGNIAYHNTKGEACGFSIKEGNEYRSYISPNALASLISAVGFAAYADVTIIGFSLSDGSSPSPSRSHKKGNVGDLRYLRTDGLSAPTNVMSSYFDIQRNEAMTAALYKFGWKDMISERVGGYLLPHTSSATERGITTNHTNHLHMQGYQPTIMETYMGINLTDIFVYGKR